MKRKSLIIAGIILSFAAVIGVLFALSQRWGKPVDSDTVKKETEVIFSFESYEEITGTGIRFNNSFGKTAVNTDKAYITDGKGSWLVQPEGDYGKTNVYPEFRMRCIETTFKTNDFDKYDKVMLDVYNASDEEVSIEWNFTVLDIGDSYVGTNKQTYKLAPNAWTTCEYELTNDEYSAYFRLEMVKYMNVKFLDKKESKDDTVPTIYFDNLRGHVAETEREMATMNYDFKEGITLENSKDRYLFTTTDHYQSLVEWQRVAYADTTLPTVDEALGEYGLRGDATGTVWPSVFVNFGEALEEDSILSFMLYVEVAPELAGDKTYYLEAFQSLEKRGNTQVLTTNCKYNEWVDVQIVFEKGTILPRVLVNLDDHTENNLFGDDVPITIYMDNFKLAEKQEEISIGKNGEIVLKNPYNRSDLEYCVEKSVKKGDIISFDIDFNTEEPLAVWVLGDDYWTDEWYAYGHEKWPGKQHVQVEAQSDSEYFYIYVQYRGETKEFAEHVCTITNIKISDEITLYNYNGAGQVMYTFKKPVKAGQHISFDIDIAPKQHVAVWVLGDDMWEDEYYAKAFETWSGKHTINANVTTDTSKFTVYIKYFDESLDWSKNVATISNVKIENGYVKTDGAGSSSSKVTVGEDGTVTIEDIAGADYLMYTYNKEVKAGECVEFDIDVKPAQNMSVWVLGDDMWNDEYYAKAYPTWNGKQTITADITSDTTKYTIYVKFYDETQDFTKNVITISNMKVKEGNVSVDKDGAVTIKNGTGAKSVSYTFNKAVAAGQEVKFDLEVTPSQTVAVWLIDGVDTTKEYIAKEFSAWENTQTFSAILEKATSKFIIKVEFRGKTPTATENTATISNVTIGEPKQEESDVTVGEDGTVTIKNSEGAKRVSYTFEQAVKAGEEVTFDMEVSPSQTVAVWLLDDTDKEYIAKEYAAWNGTQTFSTVVSKATTNFDIVVEFRDASQDVAKNVVTISNVTVKEPDISIGQDGTVTIKNGTGAKSVSYTFNKKVAAGQEVTFDLDVTPSQKVAVWLIDGDDTTKEYIAKEFPAWENTQTFSTVLEKATSKFIIKVEFRGETPTAAENTVIISNVQVKEPESDTDNVTIQNNTGTSKVSYEFDKVVAKGQQLTFNLEVTPSQTVAIWLLDMTGDWVEYIGKEYAAWEGTKTITVDITDPAEHFKLKVEFRGSNPTSTENAITVSNIVVKDAEAETDKVTIQNNTGTSKVSYEFDKVVAKGQQLTFDLEVTPSQTVAIWLLDMTGDWVEYIGKEYAAWEGTKTITVDITDPAEYFKLKVEFRGSNPTSAENAISISNIEVK